MTINLSNYMFNVNAPHPFEGSGTELPEQPTIHIINLRKRIELEIL